MKRHLGAHSGIQRKSSYRQTKTGEELSEKMFCGVCIPLRELHLFHHKAVFEQGSSESEKVIFCDALKTITKSEIS